MSIRIHLWQDISSSSIKPNNISVKLMSIDSLEMEERTCITLLGRMDKVFAYLNVQNCSFLDISRLYMATLVVPIASDNYCQISNASELSKHATT